MLTLFEQFTAAISGINRSIQKIERDEMEKYGLKGAHAKYLLAIARHPEGITAAELCETCDKDKAAISRILTEMARKTLIIRENGGYRARIQLTETGMKAARYVQEKAIAAVECAGSVMSDDDRLNLYDILARLDGKLQELCRKGIPTHTTINE